MKMQPNNIMMGEILKRKIHLKEDGTIYGGYNIQDWRPLTWGGGYEPHDNE